MPVSCFDNKTKFNLTEAGFYCAVHNKKPNDFVHPMQCGDMGKKGPGTHGLVFINGVLDTPAALRDPRRVKHWDRWHSKYWRGQGEVYTGRRDLLVDTEE